MIKMGAVFLCVFNKVYKGESRYIKTQMKGGEKMKNNKLVRLVVIALLITMVGLILISNTYAKYTSTIAGSDTAIVAKWSVSTGDAFNTFDLFTTVKDSNGKDTEDDVKADRIAPGTSGAFTVALKNDSEVTADYVITIAQSNTNIPIKYSIDGTNWYKATELATVNSALGGTLAFTGSSKITEDTPVSKDITISWKWDYSESDAQDSKDKALAEAASSSTDVTASVVFTQAD